MSIFKLTKNGKCDVNITLFTNDNQIILQNSSTFDIKPTIKELVNQYKKFKSQGAKLIRITTTPSCEVRKYKL